MEKMNALTLIITLVVGIILTGALLGPVINDASKTEKTFTNEGYYTMDEIDESTSRVITWAKANPGVITIDDTEFDMSFAETNRSYTLVGSESLVIRYQKDSSVAGLQLYAGSTYSSMHTGSSAEVGDTLTITLAAGEVTFVSNGTSPLSVTKSIGTDGYIINPSDEGDYTFVMKKADMPAYLHGDSEIKFMGVSVATGGPTAIAVYGSGTLDDGITLSTVYKPNSVTSVTYSEPVKTVTDMAEYKDLSKLDKYEFTITYDTNTYDATYSYFLVPASVTSELVAHLTPGQISLMGAIPVMVIVALLMLAVGAIALRRND